MDDNNHTTDERRDADRRGFNAESKCTDALARQPAPADDTTADTADKGQE